MGQHKAAELNLEQIARIAAKTETYMAKKLLEAIAKKWAKEGKRER